MLIQQQARKAREGASPECGVGELRLDDRGRGSGVSHEPRDLNMFDEDRNFSICSLLPPSV